MSIKKISTSIKIKREELDRLLLQGNLVRKQNVDLWDIYTKLLSDNNLNPEMHYPITQYGVDKDDFINDMRTIIITVGPYK